MLQKVPFLRILAAYIAGIILAPFFHIKCQGVLMALMILLLSTAFVLSLKNRQLLVISLSLHMFLFLAGIWRYNTFNRVPNLPTGSVYEATLLEYPVEKTNSRKTDALLTRIITHDSLISAHEKLILYFEPDNLVGSLQPGSIIVFKTQPELVANAGNPEEFDYRGYLNNKKIFRQVYLKSGEWINRGTTSHFHISICSEKLRHTLLNIYVRNGIRDEKFAMLSALTLGYRDALDPDTKKVFSSAGATHVLAVSGLHTGIIYLVIGFLFGFVKRIKRGRLLFVLISVSTLWFYALVTGLSPSVLRATIMFSFLIAGENLRRPTNVYNTLAASAFILLFVNPDLVSDVGFQLSYSAVTGIVFFQPMIHNLINFKYRISRWTWALFAVSLSAQFATFPLTFFYFKQFPVYFWASNFIVIPGAFILIFLGIAIILFSAFQSISTVLATVTNFILNSVYLLLSKFQTLPFSVIKHIYISRLQLFLLVSAIICLMFFITSRKHKYLFAILTFFVFLVSLNTVHKIQCLHQNKIIIYNARSGQMIHLVSGFRNYILYRQEDQLDSYDLVTAENVRTAGHLNKPVFIPLDSSYHDDLLYMRKGVISFEGKNLLTGTPPQFVNEEVTPDIHLANHWITVFYRNRNNNSQTLAGQVQETKTTKKFNLKKDGAFTLNF